MMTTFFKLQILALFAVSSSKEPPYVTSATIREHIVRDQTTVKLACPISSDSEPPPLIQWTKDEESIHSGWDRFKITSHGLKIRDLLEEDTGHYVCKGTNGFGSVSVEYDLYVYVEANKTSATDDVIDHEDVTSGKDTPPVFFDPDETTKYVRPVGGKMQFRCKSAGYPLPQTLWYHDGRMILKIQQESRDLRWILSLEDLQVDNAGEYTCKVFNRAGAISYTYYLEINENLNLAATPIIRLLEPLNTTVDYLGSITFECEILSKIAPHTQWLKTMSGVGHSKSNNTITVNGQEFLMLTSEFKDLPHEGIYLNKLTLSDVTEEHSGTYVCLGANNMGYSHKSVHLTVQKDPNSRHHHHHMHRPHHDNDDDKSNFKKLDVGDINADDDVTSSPTTKAPTSSPTSLLAFVVGVPSAIVVLFVVIIFSVVVCLVRRRRRHIDDDRYDATCRQQLQQEVNPTNPVVINSLGKNHTQSSSMSSSASQEKAFERQQAVLLHQQQYQQNQQRCQQYSNCNKGPNGIICNGHQQGVEASLGSGLTTAQPERVDQVPPRQLHNTVTHGDCFHTSTVLYGEC